ncbi:MAG TPA: hypothetical protein PKA82_12560 [Pyrinomonadaceae bacterium]|nr:hypothetical protein [Pyrinomonadaceae bacterium]
MSSLLWLIGFFFLILFISIVVYIVVVKFFYWGDKDKAPEGRPKKDS